METFCPEVHGTSVLLTHDGSCWLDVDDLDADMIPFPDMDMMFSTQPAAVDIEVAASRRVQTWVFPLVGVMQEVAGCKFAHATVLWYGTQDSSTPMQRRLTGVEGPDFRQTTLTMCDDSVVGRAFVLCPSSPTTAHCTRFPHGLAVPVHSGRMVTLCGTEAQRLFVFGIPPQLQCHGESDDDEAPARMVTLTAFGRTSIQ